MKDKLKQSEQAREQLAKELVRTKISLECADNTIKKQQENIKELEQENTKLQSTITKIKDIAETASPYIDNFEIKTATEVGYDYAAICNELELRLHKVLEVITKAEEEWQVKINT